MKPPRWIGLGLWAVGLFGAWTAPSEHGQHAPTLSPRRAKAVEAAPRVEGVPELGWLNPEATGFDCGNAAAMAWLSELAYAQIPPGTPDIGRIRAEVGKWWPGATIEPIHDPPVQGFIVKDGSQAVVVFRGSDSWANDTDGKSDWLHNAKAVFPGRATHTGNPRGANRRPIVPSAQDMKYESHAGFYSLFAQVHEKRTVQTQLQGYEGKPVFFTGHSLGGALSTLFARDMHENHGFEKARLYTMGAPRPGTAAINNYFVSNSIPAHRIEYGHDPVPTLPDLRFANAGALTHLSRDADGECQTETPGKLKAWSLHQVAKWTAAVSHPDHSAVNYANCLLRLKQKSGDCK